MLVPPARPLTDGVVTLRPWRAGDGAWYAAQTDDPGIQRFTGEPPGLRAEAVEAAIDRVNPQGGQVGLAITDVVTGALLGNAGLVAGSEPQSGELSYWVAAPARGRGVAGRAVTLLVGWAWECELTLLRLHTHADNAASRRVAERAGFEPFGPPGSRTVKGETWPTAWYRLRRPDTRSG